MMNVSRIAMLVFTACFSALFTASLIYSVRSALQGGSMSMNTPLFLDSLLWSSCFLIMALLMAISPLGDKIASLFFATRKKSLREEEKINPALEHVQNLYRRKFDMDLPVNVYVMDMPHINGMALGRETVAVSTGLLKVGSDDEITAVIAHEAGHLHNKDGVFNLAWLAASLPTIFLNFAFRFFVFFGPKPKLLPSGGQDLGWVTGLCIFILFLLLFAHFVVLWVLSFPVIWLMRAVEAFTEWPVEYRADRFAMELDFGPAMIELFERIEDEDIRNTTGFLSKYLYSHPPTALRIDRLERALLKS